MAAVDQKPEFGIADFARTLVRRKWTIVVTVIVVVGAVIGIESREAKVYQSTAGLLLTEAYGPNSSGGLGPLGASSIDIPNSEALLNSGLVKAKVEKELNISGAPSLTVTQAGATPLLDLTVQSNSPTLAARAANEYGYALIKVDLQQTTAAIAPAEQRQRAAIATYSLDLTSDNAELQTLLGSKSVAPQSLNSIETQIAATEGQITTVTEELYQTEILSGLNQGGGKVVNLAQPDTTPISPKLYNDGALAILGGVVLGLGFAFLREFLDDRIRTKVDLERVMGKIPSLGVIPEVPDWKDRKSSYLISIERPRSPAAEAYRGLRTAVQFIGLNSPIRTLQFTSPAANDGKTATTCNLAVAMAMSGQRVVAVSCDLRRPRLHQFFTAPNNVGLTSVLLGDVGLEEAMVSVPNVGQLLVLPSGPVPPNPSELLAGRKLAEVFEELVDHADIILIDSPPVLPVTDAAVLAGRVDAVILVAAAGYSTRHNVGRALELLDRVEAPLVGAVLNGASSIDSYGYDAGYTYRQAEGVSGLNGGNLSTDSARTNGSAPAEAGATRSGSSSGSQPSTES